MSLNRTSSLRGLTEKCELFIHSLIFKSINSFSCLGIFLQGKIND